MQILPGQYRDAETGLHYNFFRDYDPQTGRYVQSDPIGLEGGINPYGYVGSNPLIAADPMGLFAETPAVVASRVLGPVGAALGTGLTIGAASYPLVAQPLRDAIDAVCRPRRCNEYVYRVFGQGSGLFGKSWTPLDPRTAGGRYRELAGLPSVSRHQWRRNSGKYLAIGCLRDKTGVEYRPAVSLDGGEGGWPEYLVPQPQAQIEIIDVQRLSPPM